MHRVPPRRFRRAQALTAALLLGALHRVPAEEPLPNVERLRTSPVLRHLKPNPGARPDASGPAQTVAQMYVPEGFQAELVVGEPDLHQPVAFAFDDRGRIWVAEAYSYPQKQPAGQGRDKIVIFADRDGDGRFETRTVFAEGLNLVSSLEVGFGGVWVGAAPELLFLPDRNQDDVPDGAPQVLLDGFGYQDTHECLNSFLWGPDGWLYGNQGVFNFARIGKPGAAESDRVELRAGVWRYHPVRHEFEVFAHGGSNQWGLDYDERGQIFMTHCRSYFGKGGTTHVFQGGQFWNQANANYAPFIIALPPGGFPDLRNYLLASARYDHGAGGAGAPGSDAIYGGHSHVGTMIYLGDNWPAPYRGRLFTHNLHGHQINQQINLPERSGFNTVHAGQDQFFCSDPKYVAVDLQYGPDGAVYSIDWYDRQHCHNPNTERWDRSNGRIYRLQYAATYKPRSVHLGRLDDLQLVEMQSHESEWFVRTARRLLQERAATRALSAAAVEAIRERATRPGDSLQRLRALWTLHVTGGVPDEVSRRALQDADEYVRSWAVQLLTDTRRPPSAALREFVQLAAGDPSPVVRRHLASALPRIPRDTAWKVAGALAVRTEDADDRNLPLLLWQGIAMLLPADLDRAFALADTALIPRLADWIGWYASTLEGNEGLDRSLRRLARLDGEEQRRLVAALTLAVDARGNVPRPAAWKVVSARLQASPDLRVRQQADLLAAAFGDDSGFPRHRQTLADRSAGIDARRHAFAVLSRARDQESFPIFLNLLAEPPFRLQAIRLLARFDAPEVAPALIRPFESWTAEERSAALNALCSRVRFASLLLDAVAANQFKRDHLTAFHIRQLTQLKNPEINRRMADTWGRIAPSPVEKEAAITRLEKTFNEAPLWAFDGRAGREHFQKLCAQCHVLGQDGARMGPELTGAGKNGIRYFLENIIDPNAVVGTDFQMTTLETKAGDVLSGILSGETAGAVTLRTTAGESVIARSDIERRLTSDKSIMPEGLLEALNDREQIELLKYLTNN